MAINIDFTFIQHERYEVTFEEGNVFARSQYHEDLPAAPKAIAAKTAECILSYDECTKLRIEEATRAVSWDIPKKQSFIERVYDYLEGSTNKEVLRAFDQAATSWGLLDRNKFKLLLGELDPEFAKRMQARYKYNFKLSWQILKLHSDIIVHQAECLSALQLLNRAFPELFLVCYGFVLENKGRLEGLEEVLRERKIEEVAPTSMLLHIVPSADEPSERMYVSPDLKISDLEDKIRTQLEIPSFKILRVHRGDRKLIPSSQFIYNTLSEQDMVYVLVEDMKRKERTDSSSESSCSWSEELSDEGSGVEDEGEEVLKKRKIEGGAEGNRFGKGEEEVPKKDLDDDFGKAEGGVEGGGGFFAACKKIFGVVGRLWGKKVSK